MMTKFSAISSWLSSIACGVCLVLAVLATPGVARADPLCSCCGDPPQPSDPPEAHQWYNQCMSYCQAHGGSCDGVPPKPFCVPRNGGAYCDQGYCLLGTCHAVPDWDLFGDPFCCW